MTPISTLHYHGYYLSPSDHPLLHYCFRCLSFPHQWHSHCELWVTRCHFSVASRDRLRTVWFWAPPFLSRYTGCTGLSGPQTCSVCLYLGLSQGLFICRMITSKIPNSPTSFKSVQISFLSDDSCVCPEAGSHLHPLFSLPLSPMIDSFSYLCFLSQCLVNSVRPGTGSAIFFLPPSLLSFSPYNHLKHNLSYSLLKRLIIQKKCNCL